MSFLESKVLKNLITATVVIVALFVISILFYTVKVSNGDYCGVENNYNLDPLENTIRDTVINSEYDYFVQELSIDKKFINYFEYYDFCFDSQISTNSYVELEVINSDLVVLGNDLFVNSSGVSCIDIGFQDFTVDNNFVGLRCVNCDANNNVTLSSSLSSSKPTFSNGGVIVSSSLDYNLLGVKNCKHFFRTLVFWLILFVLLMSLILVIKLFVDWLERFSIDGW